MTKNNDINTNFPIDVANGGTGDASFTAYSVITGGTTSTGALQNVSGVGTSGQLLTSNGAAALPTWNTNGNASGKVVQVLTTTKTNTFTTTSSTFVNLSSLSVVITPASVSNKVLVFYYVNCGNSDAPGFLRLQRGASVILQGDTNGTNQRSTSGSFQSSSDVSQVSPSCMMYLDSPASTSALTYKITASIGGGTGTLFVNEGSATTGSSHYTFASTITVWEVTP